MAAGNIRASTGHRKTRPKCTAVVRPDQPGPSAGVLRPDFHIFRGYRGTIDADRPQIMIGLLCTSDGIPIAHFRGTPTTPPPWPPFSFSLSRTPTSAYSDGGDPEHPLHDRSKHDRGLSTRPLTRPRLYLRGRLRGSGHRTEIAPTPIQTPGAPRTCRHAQRTKIGAAAQRILASGGAGLFDTEIGAGRFLYEAPTHTKNPRRRASYQPHTHPRTPKSWTTTASSQQSKPASAPQRSLRLRPVRHWTEQRVRGHVAVCVYAALIETLINHALAGADVRDPDLGDQHLTAARALRDLNRIRPPTHRQRPPNPPHHPAQPPTSPYPHRHGADTHTWDKATITWTTSPPHRPCSGNTPPPNPL